MRPGGSHRRHPCRRVMNHGQQQRGRDVANRRARRPTLGGIAAAVLAVTVAALAAGATTASAATPLSRLVAQWRTSNLARAHVMPRLTWASFYVLEAGPKAVTVNGVQYEMALTVFDFPGDPTAQPAAFVDLQRVAPAAGTPTAFQLHDYA